ncbi:MAG TPA: dihydrofolate reductase family protein [Jatrophihabitantaceae bacterium]|jgi:dihydrofolate reductase|nr:dihydrofolate reductase family protein [Jatrophihabitantaceae bacterium]
MTRVTCNISVSVDGFVAGPRQGLDTPLGEGGIRLHEWHFTPQGDDQKVVDEWQRSPGAYIMGRNMFAPGRGEWDLDWRGWWGDEPPYQAPVFVLTHYPRDSLTMDGGTTFHFVTDGIEAALEQATAAAGEKPVEIAGGASAVNAYLAAGAIDELHLHISPVLLGQGERLFDGVRTDLQFEPIEVVASPSVTHVKYRVGRPS